MNPSRPFIMRPVATALLMVAIVLAGLVGFRLLPLSALPQVDYPTIQVQTLYPGGSPEVMAQTVTAPLEKQFGQMPGLSRMSSTSAAGVSMITLQFSLGLALDVAEQQVQAAINAGATRSYTINANDQLMAASDYREMVVAYRNNAPVRLKDIAKAVQSAENVKLGAWAVVDGELKPAVILNVQRQPGANVIQTVDAI